MSEVELGSHLSWQRAWSRIPAYEAGKGREENAIWTPGEAKKLQALLAIVCALQSCHAP